MSSVPAADLAPETKDELLCAYAALILHDDGADIDPANMVAMIKAAGCTVEGYWPPLFAKMIKGQGGAGALLKMCGGGGGGGGGGGAPAAAAGGGGGGGDAPAKKEEKKEEEEEEEMEFDLFG
eukprot:gnl/TRDRNA2_/TRDRNA2_37163_c0_seq1.p2 gnl/TRDRNA2_/TRDRNA2_37163_c0~~gnl/TRDRNA2_/TRDRNA2_37163_c0_seq1.p2  ORF type:complete len:123 (-),score=54.05 gnl/TRDRNA2_/TRDRNA2_37163_c0_seq1:65-433(-)